MCFELCDCTHKEGRCAILGLAFLGFLFSLGVAVSMGILMYPGFDECLLFVGVRGEALIYGNPHGCNFMIVGHLGIILSGSDHDVHSLKMHLNYASRKYSTAKDEKFHIFFHFRFRRFIPIIP